MVFSAQQAAVGAMFLVSVAGLIWAAHDARAIIRDLQTRRDVTLLGIGKNGVLFVDFRHAARLYTEITGDHERVRRVYAVYGGACLTFVASLMVGFVMLGRGR